MTTAAIKAERILETRELLKTHTTSGILDVLTDKYGMSTSTAYRMIRNAREDNPEMANPSKKKGTEGETAVVSAAHIAGFTDATRTVQHGRYDQGDISLCKEVIIEVKAGHAAERASEEQISRWLHETETERINAGADYGLLVTKVKGKSGVNAAMWSGWMYFRDYMRLALTRNRVCTYPDFYEWFDGQMAAAPVRMNLGDYFQLLRHAGFKNPEVTETLTVVG